MRAAVNAVLQKIAERKDLFFLAFLFVFVLMFIVPVPPGVIDVLITINIALTLVVIIAATYLKHPTDLSTFPAIILFSTVFRLAITVASSRLILSEADAGDLIRAFGTFVISGKLLVGLIVFLIVAIVLFIVVVKGVERIAEVGARFTLDALPGKQMSIDSDLRNGDITKEEARNRRARLAQESQFFGAMDGAMRFVKGDAIAGFVIIFVNLVGGILVGMLSRGMGFGEAARTYSLLTVGEGLVSQIPAMLVAIAAGIVATRVAGDGSSDLGSDIAGELVANTQSLIIAGGAMALLSFMPGFPFGVFVFVAALLIGTGILLTPSFHFWRPAEPEPAASPVEAVADMAVPAAPAPFIWPAAERGDLFQFAAAPDVAAAVRTSALAETVAAEVKALGAALGFAVPMPSLREDPRLAAGHYRFEVDEVPVHQGHWQAGGWSLITTLGEAKALNLADRFQEHALLGGIATVSAGSTVPKERLLDAPALIAREIEAALKQNASTAFGLSDATQWLAQHGTRHGALVAQVQQAMPMLRLVDIGRRLIDEGVPLSPPRALLEALLHAAEQKLDVTQSVELVRRYLRRQIVYTVTQGADSLPAFLLEPSVETRLSAIARVQPGEAEATRPAGDISGTTFARVIRAAAQDAQGQSLAPVLVTTTRVRALAQAILRRHGVRIPVLSLEEVGTETQIRPLRALTVAELGLA